ncbi:MAG: siderophore-interacting protein [Gulosibacter sp.]|uniref:siderophore-interacting protein n=1 Tax=Gulosibacter sp. TaxID=2817531 RepID=UPI003F91F60C
MTVPFKFFPVQVSAIRDLSSGFRRFTFAGPSLATFGDPGLDQRIKLVFPIAGGDYSELLGATDWYGTWRELPDERRHPIRTYTTRYVRQEACELDVDVVVHDVVGPASAWIEHAAVGDELLVLGPNAEFDGEPGGIDFVPPASTEQYLIAGDETAAPAIAVILESLPATARGIAVLEVPSADDAAYLPSHPGIDVRVVPRDGGDHGSVLVSATRGAVAELAPIGTPQEVEEIDVDSDLLWEVPRHAKGGAALKHTSLYAWFAGEAGAVKTLRRHLVSERGIDRRTVAFMGYWRLGKAEN